MLEKFLILHCSPTLAGIKTGNLFHFWFASAGEFKIELQETNKKLNGKGIFLEVLRIQNSRALILAYRPERLAKDFRKTGAVSFLNQLGYTNADTEYAIKKLKKRFAVQMDFPHEIGLFLGYPLADVVGFIENQGQNSKCAGYWKVYRDEKEAAKMFQRFKKCKDVYLEMFAKGRSITQLTIAA